MCKMKIRVLHVIDHLGYGGAPIIVKNIAEGIDKERIETFVCSLRENPQALSIGAKLINLKYGKYNPYVVIAIAKLCREYRIDIIHAHLPKSIISSLLAVFFCDGKIIIHEHGWIFSGGTGCIYRLLLKILGTRAAVTIANSRATKAALIHTAGLAENSIVVVTNFTDFSQFDCALYDRNKVRSALGVDEHKIVVGFMGRLASYKGADLLIKAAAILCRRNRKFCFVVAGDGPERKRLEKLANRLGLQEKIIFTGLCKKPAEVIRAFDIAVIPSRYEAFGITAVEFMRMKVPIIASQVGGLVELVQHEQTGVLLDSLTVENIADAVDTLAGDGSLRGRLAETAEVFSRRFDGKEQLRQITDIYEKLCPQKRLVTE